MRLGTTVLALAAASVVGTAAFAAGVTASDISLVGKAVSAGASTDDPNLANAKTFDLTINVPTGEDYTSTNLLANLTGSGVTFYSPAIGGANTPNSAFWAVPGFRNTEFDTFVSGPGFTVPTILGKSQFPVGGPGPAEFSSTKIDVAYGDLITTASGSFVNARLTILGLPSGVVVVPGSVANAAATIVGDAASSGNPNGIGTPFSFSLVVPEPASAALMGLGLGAIALRRRTK